MTVTVTDIVAVLALVISGGAFALEIRRWVESGPRLYLSIMADAVEFPEDDGKPKLALTVINRGSQPTEITHYIVFAFKTPLHRFLRKSYISGIVKGRSNLDVHSQIPFKLDIAGRWLGMAYYSDDMVAAREKRQLYVGVVASHSSKNFLRRVPRAPKKEIGQKPA